MTKLLVRPAAAPRRTRVGRSRLSTRNLGYLGLGWALAYIPVHLYWAFGGLSTPIGITGHQPGFRVANWGACVVIAGAALTCLTLTQRWGSALPAGLRRGTAWVGGVFGLAHWTLYTTYCALRVAGAVGYPGDGDLTGQQMRNFDWANLGYFELWFGVMGVLLIACARRNKAQEVLGRGAGANRRATWPARFGTGLSLTGIAVVVWGVFTFHPWLFAGWGPAVLAAGLAILILGNRTSGNRAGSDR
jgi:hypothetical protein